LVTVLVTLAGYRPGWSIPAAFSVLLGGAMFFAPDLVTRVNAAQRAHRLRYALTSYLDLVVLERGAGAGPTEALEAGARIGGGWAFARIEQRSTPRARPAGHPGRGWPHWPGRRASANSPTSPTSRR